MKYLRVGPLVRAVAATSAVIWAEFTQPCTVTLSVTLDTAEQPSLLVETHTLAVGGHHYAAPQIEGLQAGRWYQYRLDASLVAQEEQTANPTIETPESTEPGVCCFRTLDDAETKADQPLRVLYGSCRQLNRPEQDTLDALGQWLVQHREQREQIWPHVLLHIGDQIYADMPPPQFVKLHPHLKDGVSSFEDFTSLYIYDWTTTAHVREALACIPSFMICDDHEITNNWNSTPTWRARMLQSGKEQLLVDGLVAYWVYQGWGNLVQRDPTHSLLRIMQEAEQSGEDALEALRACIKQAVYGDSDLRWHYTIPTIPPIFVSCTRTNRSYTFSRGSDEQYAPTHLMSEQQMAELRSWLGEQEETGVALLVSSIPVLLPPFIGLAEYLTGVRLWTDASNGSLNWLGRRLARIQRNVANRAGFEHWPAFIQSWDDLIASVAQQKRDVVVLAGDVHFSYAVEGRPVAATHGQRLYQLVSTPIENLLEGRALTMIRGQAVITRASYGGVASHVLPLEVQGEGIHTLHNLLFENTLALVTVTLQPQQEQKYTLQQEYFGNVNGQFQLIARTVLSR